jgi:hypothetical protein
MPEKAEGIMIPMTRNKMVMNVHLNFFLRRRSGRNIRK